jgi:hypothetical protein
MIQYLNDHQISNNPRIFCVISTTGVGCTFLEWSIHWLLGNSTYLNFAKQTEIPLVNNPLTAINSHLHKKNHPAGLDSTKNVIKFLKEYNNTNWGSLYPRELYIDQAVKKLNYNVDRLSELSADEWQQTTDHIADDYATLWKLCGAEDVRRIILSLDKNNTLYSMAVRSLDRQIMVPIPYLNEDERRNIVYNHFFSDSLNSYNVNNLIELPIWDQRELLALNLRPYSNFLSVDKLDLTTEHKCINAQQLWHNGEETMSEIFDYLGESIVQSRLTHWKNVYAHWQGLQLKILKFVYDINHIIDSIINNYYYDLRSYNLTLQQEVIIQHMLIYKYNVTIKNWQLEKFPDNTQDLHNLLEPSFYNIENIYNI